MNERIRELMNQTGVPVSMPFDKWCEKFSELVVLECIGKIEAYQIPVGNSVAGEMACKWTHEALKEILDDIKQHFGVE